MKMKLVKCITNLSFCSLMITTMLLIFFSCDKKEAKLLETQDTLKLSLNLNAGGNSYVFNLTPGDSEPTSGASQTYENSGSVSTNANNKIGTITKYVELIDKVKNVSVKIGFSFMPAQTIIANSSDKCILLEQEFDKYFVPRSYPICNSWGSGDFLSCSNGSKDDFYFQIEFDDRANGKNFKSGIQQVVGSFFRIDKIQKLHFADSKGSAGSFDWVIQGEFNLTMQAYKFGVADSPNAEVLKMENSQFKLGLHDICF